MYLGSAKRSKSDVTHVSSRNKPSACVFRPSHSHFPVIAYSFDLFLFANASAISLSIIFYTAPIYTAGLRKKKNTHTHTCTHTRTHARTHARMHARTHTHTEKRQQANTHTLGFSGVNLKKCQQCFWLSAPLNILSAICVLVFFFLLIKHIIWPHCAFFLSF